MFFTLNKEDDKFKISFNFKRCRCVINFFLNSSNNKRGKIFLYADNQIITLAWLTFFSYPQIIFHNTIDKEVDIQIL